MTLRDLITVYSCFAIQEDCFKLTDLLEQPEKKIRLCFDETNESKNYNKATDNVVLPASHPALIAWYDYEVKFIDVPQKDVIDVYFKNVRLDR